MTDLATAPQTGASEAATPAPTTAAPETTSVPASEAKSAPSAREAIERAMDMVNSRPANETEKAVAVLREGQGADDKLAAERTTNADKAETASEASERARKGWETRRANAEKPEVEAKPAVAEAPKPAEPAKPAEPVKAPEPSRYQAPARLAPEAKAVWDAAPESLRAEVVRMHDELTAGITKHKAEAERFAPLADFEKRSQEVYNQPLAATLKNYVELDELLSTDPLAGLERIVSSMTYKDDAGKTHNWTLKQLAQYVTEQDAETFDNKNLDLERKLDAALKKIDSLEQGLTQNRESETQKRQASITSQIEAFAKEAPRYAELETHILKLLKSDLIDRSGDPARDLKAAYELAERLNPAPSLSPPAPEIPAPDLAAQTRRGQASVSGAPGPGSNPVGKKPVPTSNRDAVKQAFASLGIAQ